MSIEVPEPDRNYADHSYPAYSEKVLIAYGETCAAAEREACAKVCDAQHDRARTSAGAARADACATAIRARGVAA